MVLVRVVYFLYVKMSMVHRGKVISMLEILIDKICFEYGDRFFQQVVSIPM